MDYDSFSNFHPSVNMLFFCSVIGLSMFVMHPWIIAISLVCAGAYNINLKAGVKLKSIIYMLPMVVFMSAFNPIFNHEGQTILLYFNSGNPLTLESIIYGIVAALMFFSVILWFSSYNCVMTSEKFIYLFGAIIPSLSMVIAMVLRFVPRYVLKVKEIINAQKAFGYTLQRGKLIHRLKSASKVMSILVTWALEDAIITSDSMQSRGYGLKGRTSFHNYFFEMRDVFALVFIVVVDGVQLIALRYGWIRVRYYPTVILQVNNKAGVVGLLLFTLLCSFPLIVKVLEALKWKQLESRI